MTRTTISLPPEVDAALRREARRRGVPVSQIAREALEVCLGIGRSRRDLPFIGIIHSGRDDISENFDAFIEAEWKKLDRDR